MEEKKIFFGNLNSDNSDYSLPKEDYLNAVNIDVVTPKDGEVGNVRAMYGNRLVESTPAPLGTNKVIGSCEDPANNRILYISVNDSVGLFSGSFIFAHDIATEEKILVFRFNDFLDGKIEYSLTDSIDSMVVKGDFLIWTSVGHPPYKLNINRAIERNNPNTYPDVTPYGNFQTPKDIEIAKKSPQYPPYLNVQLTTSNSGDITYYRENYWKLNGDGNFLGENSFLFSTRYVYNDGDISVQSPYSSVAQPSSIDRNGIRVMYSSTAYPAAFDVAYVELIVKHGNNGQSFVIDRVTPEDYPTAYFDFYNTVSGDALSDDYVANLFESVPLEAGTIESVNNRLVTGNNKSGYDPIETTTLTASPAYIDDINPVTKYSTITFTPQCDLEYKSSENIKAYEVIREWLVDGNISYQFIEVYLALYINSSWYPNGWYIIPEISFPPQLSLFTYGLGADWVAFKDSADIKNMIFLGDKLEDIVGLELGERFEWSGEYIERRRFVDISNLAYIHSNSPSLLNPFSITVPQINHKTFVNNDIIFKSGSSINLGIAYYDESGRKSYVTTNDVNIKTPKFSYNMVDESDNCHVKYIEWDLDSNTENVPIWATNYQIVRTKPKINYFYQFRSDQVMYAFKDGAEPYKSILYETEVFGDNVINPNNVFIKVKTGGWNVCYGKYKDYFSAIAIPLTYLNNKDIGYTFTEGDTITIIKQNSTARYKLRIIDVSGGYVFAEARNIGDIDFVKTFNQSTLSSKNTAIIKAADSFRPIPWNYFCEISSPNSSSGDLYYEVSKSYPIIRDSWSSEIGTLSVISGKISGDVYIQRDGPYFFEVMNRGKLYHRWETDAMKPNIPYDLNNSVGQTEQLTSLKWSGNYIYGTKINNLSSFNAFDEEILSGDIGSIQKLVFTSKLAEYGNVLLVIGETATLSVYIDENILTDTEGSEQVQQSTKFIGAIRELKGNYGTLHPESVVEYKGNVYWWDENNKCVVRYSEAGLFPVSDYKMTSFFRKLDTKNIKMYGGFNPRTNEYFITIPEINSETIEYPEDWDGGQICEDTTTTGWGDGFVVAWGDYTCVKTAELTWGVNWGNYTCVTVGITFPQVEWGDYTCVKQDSSSVFRIYWGDYTCVQEAAQFGVSWSDYTCVKYNDTGTFTAVWDSKICVKVVD